MTSTTLSTALTAVAADNSVVVASATGITGEGTYGNTTVHLMINGEIMAVRSISSTTALVTRGVWGTPIQSHPANSKVLILIPGDEPKPYPAGYMTGVTFYNTLPQTVATATSVTLTAMQMLSGLILQDPAGGAVTTTGPTAALLLAEIAARIGGDVPIGLSFMLVIRNTADAAETITVAAGTGGTVTGGGTMTIAQNNSKLFIVRVTGTGASAAYIIYSVGTFVH